MKSIILLFLLSLTSAIPLESSLPSFPLQDHSVFVPEWEVEITTGGPKTLLRVTVEEVHAQLLALNPNWDSDFPAQTPADDTSPLVKRTDFWDSPHICQFKSARLTPIHQGIAYLRRVSGQPKNGAGPANCGRVSCSYESAIWWCNDSKSPKTLNSFGSIADGALQICNRCGDVPAGSTLGFVSGQIFHHTNWNVIVRGEKC